MDKPICDREDKSVEGGKCQNEAVVEYVFPWGEKGYCCAKHQQEIAQAVQQIERTVQFVPLAAAGDPPLERPERTRLKGEIYALEEELKEVKDRGVDMYNQNTRLTQQVQALTVRNRESEAQLRDAGARIDRLEAELQRRMAELGDAVDEVGRLRVLLPLEPKPETLSVSQPT